MKIMKKMKAVGLILAAALFVAGSGRIVHADELTAAQQQQLLLLMQTPEYQAALAAQQAQLAAQQAAQAQQLAKQYQAAQQAALAQYQAAWNAQYQAALQVYTNAKYLQARAVNQTYLLNSTQAQQRAQYEAMINKLPLDYKAHLMQQYTDAQYRALKAYMGYNGL